MQGSTSNKTGNSGVVHAMTIDVEDYYHVSAFKDVIKVDQWEDYPSRVEQNTDKLLALFDAKAVKATFFVLGWVAERYPEIVRKIDAAGHEIASHGYSHQLVFNQNQDVFYDETKRSKEILEDIIQRPVEGYRAASYSITRQSIWALDMLAELGFTWDSSIFPVRHDTYGIPGSPEEPYIITTKKGLKIKELPLTTAKVMGLSIPAAGGGYFRQYPYILSRWLFNRSSLGGSRPSIFYLHPWEVDPEQPRIENASLKSRFRHYTNLKRCMPRLEKMLSDFSFGTVSDSLSSIEITKSLDLNNI